MSAVHGRGLVKRYEPDLLGVLGNALWLIGLTAALFVIPVRAMRRRLLA